MPNAYEILELTPNATSKEIKAAYRRLAQQYHPDRNPQQPRLAAEKFDRIQKAYDLLNTPEKRRQYDQRQHVQAMPHRPMSRRLAGIDGDELIQTATQMAGKARQFLTQFLNRD